MGQWLTLVGDYLKDWQLAQGVVQVNAAMQLGHVYACEEVKVRVDWSSFHEIRCCRLLHWVQFGTTCTMLTLCHRVLMECTKAKISAFNARFDLNKGIAAKKCLHSSLGEGQ